jgi:hypothetical protein
METDFQTIRNLIERPSESLSVEVKRWINPDDIEGPGKIVRAVLALRNHGGGYLVIGFDNDTFQPDTENIPPDVRASFHIDKIQGLVTKYASDPFEIAVEFGERGGQLYPVVIVPPGVKTPVAAKADLLLNNKKLIGTDDVYVRSLRANNTPSTTKASWKDWPTITEVCFDNREADIGRFLRRHLIGVTPETLNTLAAAMTATSERKVSSDEVLRGYLRESEQRYQAVVSERGLSLPPHGTWEVALVFLGEIPTHRATAHFLNLLAASNPGYTGWPIWLDSREFGDRTARPYVFDGGWEALVVSMGTGLSDQIDFMRLDPRGRFYLLRPLQDDISASGRAPKPLAELDFGLPIIRTAEAIAVGLAFAKDMGCVPDNCVLAFAFRWKGLRGRQLTAWAQSGRYISPGRRAYQDEVTVPVNVPFDVSMGALGEFVNQVVQPLYAVFDGFTLSKDIVEDMTNRLIQRKL